MAITHKCQSCGGIGHFELEHDPLDSIPCMACNSTGTRDLEGITTTAIDDDLGDVLDKAARDFNLGPTGKFPKGVLRNSTGELRVGITNHKGRVIVKFGTMIEEVSLDPNTADALANELREHANAIRRDGTWVY